MNQLKLLAGVIIRARSIVTGLQRTAYALMLLAAAGTVLAGIGLFLFSAPWLVTGVVVGLFLVPVVGLWVWQDRLSPAVGLLTSVHGLVTQAEEVEDLADHVGQGQKWVEDELALLESKLGANIERSQPKTWLALLSPRRLVGSAWQARSIVETVRESVLGQATATVAVVNMGTLVVVGLLAAAALTVAF